MLKLVSSLFVNSRTDGYLPIRLDQWTNVAQCFKSSNEQPECLRAEDCLKDDGMYCKSFAKGRGRDLGSAAFYRILTQEDKEGGGRGWRFWTIDLQGSSTAWAIIAAVAGVNEQNPVLSAAGASCDKESGSAFPSVYGEENDILLLSQSFDDNAKESHFQPPDGTSLIGWITGADEVSFCLIVLYCTNLQFNTHLAYLIIQRIKDRVRIWGEAHSSGRDRKAHNRRSRRTTK